MCTRITFSHNLRLEFKCDRTESDGDAVEDHGEVDDDGLLSELRLAQPAREELAHFAREPGHNRRHERGAD